MAVTLAASTADPDGSVTSPARVARYSCAKPRPANATIVQKAVAAGNFIALLQIVSGKRRLDQGRYPKQRPIISRYSRNRTRETLEVAKILLVEDNEMNRDMLSRRLERKGYQVLIAVDGGEGVEMAQSQSPDL